MFKFFRKNQKKSVDFNNRRNFLKKSMNIGIGSAIVTSPFLSNAAKASISFKNNEIKYNSIKELFFKISQINELKPFQNGAYFKLNQKNIHLYKGENPIYNGENIPTIIFISDVHLGNIKPENYTDKQKEKFGFEDQSYRVELKQIEILKERFGLNLVGIEGWAGDRVDKKRGYKIINGENILVNNMISRFDYNIVGLENEITQIEGLEILLSYVFFNFNMEYQKLLLEFNSEKFKNLFLKVLEIYLKYSNIYGNFEIINTKIRDTIFEEFNKKNSDEFILFFGKIYSIFSNELNLIMKKIKQIYNLDNISLNKFMKLNEKLIKKYRTENMPFEINLQFNSEKREIEAIKILEKYLIKNNIVVMVFGTNHINGLIEKFKKRYNDKINIYVTI